MPLIQLGYVRLSLCTLEWNIFFVWAWRWECFHCRQPVEDRCQGTTGNLLHLRVTSANSPQSHNQKWSNSANILISFAGDSNQSPSTWRSTALWLQPCKTLSRRGSSIVARFLTHRDGEKISVVLSNQVCCTLDPGTIY